MSERMTPIPFRELMTWIAAEHQRDGSVFGVHRPYVAGAKKLPIFGETIETPFGPAAGPNTQLAQNIIASYYGGARFFELKTVQKMDGEELAKCINRPCILAEDECYNCEWSTELTVPQAFDEYVKAWCALKIMICGRNCRIFSTGQFHHSSCFNFLMVSSSKRFLISFAGMPPTTVYGGTSFVTTALAPMIAPSPIWTPDRITAS